MRVTDIARAIESWAPLWTAWERDNVGLQVGRPDSEVRRILVTLDVTREVVREASRRRAELIVSHHPLLFRPPRTVVSSDAVGALVLSLAEKKIALYSAHTNLDFAPGGVSFALATRLGLRDLRFLAPCKGLLAKITVFVPPGHLERVREAMARAGGGTIGEYTECSFAVSGKGSFRGSERSNPALGSRGSLELVDEIRLEMIAPRAMLPAIIPAMKSAHPYEEVAHDVVLLENPSPNFGAGAVGELDRPASLAGFLRRVRSRLRLQGVRYVGSKTARVRTVAVCGGSGSEFLPAAIAAGAEVYVTADVRYHTFHEADGRIALIDAGHAETERVVLPEIRKRLLAAADARGQNMNVFIAENPTNAVHSY